MPVNQKKVLFIDSAHPTLEMKLLKSGYQCSQYKGDRDELKKIIHQYFGLIVRSRIKIDEELIDLAENLKFIGRLGAGMENIDFDYAAHKGIHCLNAPEGNRDAVAEHATGMLLALTNNLLRADREVRTGIWNRELNRGNEVKGKTVGIIGYGNTGGAFARIMKGIGANVLAYDKYKFNFSDDFVLEATMNEICEKTDILSFHVPLTEETNYLCNIAYLEKFKNNIYLINTSRGKVVKTDDLVTELESGKVIGACLDVIEYEEFSFEKFDHSKTPESFRKLCQMQNVVLSPHIAGLTFESQIKLAETLAEKIKGLEFP